MEVKSILSYLAATVFAIGTNEHCIEYDITILILIFMQLSKIHWYLFHQNVVKVFYYLHYTNAK